MSAGLSRVSSFPRPSGNLSRKLSRIKNPKGHLLELGALFFPCLSLGFAAWWGLLPDQVLLSSASFLDPSFLLSVKVVEGSSSGLLPGAIEQSFDPKVSPLTIVGEEVKEAFTEINSAIREKRYGPAAVLLLGAVAALVLLSSGSGNK